MSNNNNQDIGIIVGGTYFIANYVKWYGRYFAKVQILEIKPKKQYKSTYYSIKLAHIENPHMPASGTSWIHGCSNREISHRFLQTNKADWV